MPFTAIKSKRNRLLFALSTFFFIWFFLFTFKVFNFNDYSAVDRFYRTFIYSFFMLITLLINFFVLQDFVLQHYNFLKIFLWFVWLALCVGISNFLVGSLIFDRYDFSPLSFWVSQSHVFSIFLLMFPIILIVNYLVSLKKQLNRMNDLSEKLKYHNTKPTGPDIIRIDSKYKNDRFAVEMSRVLYLSSAGNYIKVIYLDNQKIEKHLVRNTISSIENKKLHPSLVRCHRSYMVNIDQVKSIKRFDGNDYLALNQENVQIPLSKSYKKFIQQLFDENN